MNHTELRSLRKKHGLSQTKAAALVHVTQRTWARYESGRQEVPRDVVDLFCLKLGIEIEG